MSYITCHTEEEFAQAVETAIAWSATQDACVDIFSAFGTDDGKATVGFSIYDDSNQYQSVVIHTDFDLGRKVFKAAGNATECLCQEGKPTSGAYPPRNATHVLTRQRGKMAGTGEPAFQDYYLALSDADAMVAAMRYGGRLRRL